MIKVTVKQILESREVFLVIARTKLKVGISYKLKKLLDAINSELKVIASMQEQIKLRTDLSNEEKHANLQDLLKVCIDINLDKIVIDLADLSDTLLSVIDIASIDPFFEFVTAA